MSMAIGKRERYSPTPKINNIVVFRITTEFLLDYLAKGDLKRLRSSFHKT